MHSTFGDIHQNVGIWLQRLAQYLDLPEVYDIGAHTGMFTIALADLGCRVTAFEPVPSTLKELQRNVHDSKAADRIRIVERGLSNQDERVVIHQFSDETFNSLFPRSDAERSHYQLEVSGHAEIRVQPLDQLQQELSLPDPGLIKMDIEGAELYALQGAAHLLQNARPFILVEYSTENCRNAGYERRDLVHELQRHNYTALGLYRNTDERLYGPEHFNDPRIWNLIAVPGEAIDRFMSDFQSYKEW
ncbi:FkbM family methyltransferase [Spirochaeta africana]|uniref:Methyltransferase, FkbM family n=1 Tax=Spirochaeta africana (strain ATCC 700263 / DSM 8902 / Z-7692) TaxID=889378 RepID=H9UH02_SPIAZ|nr:FkbM family methyltransferase [Spirochaeta africana]AFG36795.1 methyltransferase, FkbM family [Spirochaeta africana DSM 8902]